MKRTLSLLLALLLTLPALGEELDEEALAALPATTSAPASLPEDAPDQVYAASDVSEADTDEERIDTGEVPGFVEKLLEVASGEIGYTEGPNNRTKYGEWSGDPNAAWCAEFVCWCIHQVDERYGTELLGSVYPNWGSQNVGRDWFIKRGRFVYRKGNCPGWGYQWLKGASRNLSKNDYIPRPGDLVFFSYNEAGDTEHVALVEYCTRDIHGEVILHVIEGNNPSAVQRNRYKLNNGQVLGFGLSEDRIDTTMRYGNSGDKVLALQQRLYRLGLLKESQMTGTFGANTKRAVMTFQEGMADHSANGIADRETQQALEAAVLRQEYDSPDTWLVE